MCFFPADPRFPRVPQPVPPTSPVMCLYPVRSSRRIATAARVGCLLAALASGLSATDHWVTTQSGFNQLNALDFGPGDRIFLAGGMTFTGTLRFDAADSGTDSSGQLVAPIVVTSFGSGRATIASGDEPAILAYNCGGFEISRLNLTGSGVAPDGTTTSDSSGLVFYNDLPGNVKFQHLRLDEIEASGFGERGVVIGGFNGSSGYHDVRLTRIVARDNRHTGIETFGFTGVTNALTQVLVADCHAFNQRGDPDRTTNTGSGIVLGGVDGGVIERCLAHDNGWNNSASEGPVGIWAYHSANIVIQHCESHHNRTSGGDGGGFDLDIQVSNSVMQYNFSHDNAGAGFLVYGTSGSNINQGNTVRYNLSENDGRDTGSPAASGIFVANHVRDLNIHGNTVRLAAPPFGTNIPAIKIRSQGFNPDEVIIANNLFTTSGGSRLVDTDSDGDVLFAGNHYWSGGASFVIRDNGQNFSSLSSWRSSRGQERLGGQAVGGSGDPRFKVPPAGGNPALNRLIALQLRGDSPLVDRGLDLAARFGINPGPRDYFNILTPQGGGSDVGAHETGTGAPKILSVRHDPAASSFTIRYQSEFGVAFGLRRSPDLQGDPEASWTVLPDTPPGDGGVMEVTDFAPPGRAHFYVLVRP